MEPLVSIIIPTYNRVNFIEKVVLSASRQNYKNLEILVVDYNSDDGTKELVLKLANKDSRIKYLNSPNKGPSCQRSFGVLNCNGEYVQFIDSDDYVSNEFTNFPVKLAIKNSADLVIFSYTSSRDFEVSNFSDVLHGNELKKKVNHLYKANFGLACWRKLIKKSLAIEVCKRYYNSYFKIYEDSVFSYGVYSLASKVVLNESKLYFYNQESDNNRCSSFENLISDYVSCIDTTAVLDKILIENGANHRQSGNFLFEIFIKILFKNLSASYHEYKKAFLKYYQKPYFSKLEVFKNNYCKSEKLLMLFVKHKLVRLSFLIAKHIKS